MKATNAALNAELQSVKDKVANATTKEFASARVSALWQKVQASRVVYSRCRHSFTMCLIQASSLSATEKSRLRGDLEAMQRKLDKVAWLQTQDTDAPHADEGKSSGHGKHGKVCVE